MRAKQLEVRLEILLRNEHNIIFGKLGMKKSERHDEQDEQNILITSTIAPSRAVTLAGANLPAYSTNLTIQQLSPNSFKSGNF